MCSKSIFREWLRIEGNYRIWVSSFDIQKYLTFESSFGIWENSLELRENCGVWVLSFDIQIPVIWEKFWDLRESLDLRENCRIWVLSFDIQLPEIWEVLKFGRIPWFEYQVLHSDTTVAFLITEDSLNSPIE